ncbi:GspH/FimT family protein [Psychromonas sp. SA13A]|uniref:GspH/FimT family pseudopilin n=1 Tax=Psychromonas sp. SA13A TaxID=2686346 RepID=UPI0014082000|nr:GspH/FimT family protein [Psychromonas sp. SA13A]
MKKSGFTITEMLITLSILAILLALSVPNFRNLISNGNMVSNTNAMIGAFNYARMEAIKRGSTVNVNQIGGDWTEGIVVWANTDAINAMSTDEVLRIWPAFDDASTVSSAQSTFSFNAVGGVNNNSVFEVCDNRTGEQGMQVSILISGVIIADKVNCE